VVPGPPSKGGLPEATHALRSACDGPNGPDRPPGLCLLCLRSPSTRHLATPLAHRPSPGLLPTLRWSAVLRVGWAGGAVGPWWAGSRLATGAVGAAPDGLRGARPRAPVRQDLAQVLATPGAALGSRMAVSHPRGGAPSPHLS